MGNSQDKDISPNEKVRELEESFNSLKGGPRKRLSVDVFARKMHGLSFSNDRLQSKSSSNIEAEIKGMFQEKDEIDFVDYLKFYMQISSESEIRSVLAEMFKGIDGYDGFLTPSKLVQLEQKLGKSIDDLEAKRIIAEWDQNGDEKLDLDEFIRYKTHDI